MGETKRWAVTQLIYSEILSALEHDFTVLNISYMPIKGAYLIVSGIAEKLADRRISDIDILVAGSDLACVTHYFQSHPKCTLLLSYQNNYRKTESVFCYNYGDAAVTLEFMSAINAPARFLLPAEDLFLRSRGVSLLCRYPSAEDALLIMLCHLQSHMAFEFRATTYREMALLLNDPALDKNRFIALAKKTGMVRFIALMMALYEKSGEKGFVSMKRDLYSRIVAAVFTDTWYHHKSRLARRIFLDIPYVRQPVVVLVNAFVQRIRKKRVHS